MDRNKVAPLLVILLTYGAIAQAVNYTEADPTPIILLSASSDTLTVSSSGTVTSTDATATVRMNNDTSVTNSGTISSTGGANVAIAAVSAAGGNFTITNNAGATISGSTYAIDNNIVTGDATINNAGTITGPIRMGTTAASATININGSGSISGSISGSGMTLTIGAASSAPNFSLDSTISGAFDTINLNNNSKMTTNVAIPSVTGGINVSNGSTLILNSTLDGNSIFANNGTMTINGVIGNTTGTCRLRNATSNDATMTINANVTATGGEFTNGTGGGASGSLTIAGNVTITGNDLSTFAGSTVTISGNRTLDATSYTNVGTHVTSITNSSTFDSLTCTNGPIDLSNATLTVNHSGGYVSSKTFTILSGNAAASGPTTTNLPSNAGFVTWSSAVSGNDINVTATRNGYNTFTSNPQNTSIAEILEDLGSTATGELSTLLDALESQGSSDIESAIEKLTHEKHHDAISSNIAHMQTLDITELRLASLRDSDNESVSGMAAGDKMTPIKATWIKPFASYTKQKKVGSVNGYNSELLGVAFGIDNKFNNLTLGSAFSYTFTKVKPKTNRSQTFVKGYQAILYGDYNFSNDAFIGTLLSAAFNDYKGYRNININTFQRRAIVNYNGQFAAARIIAGKPLKSEKGKIELVPLISGQYSYLHQNSHTEKNAGAANLYINPKSVHALEVGLGAKLKLISKSSSHRKISSYIQFMALYDFFNSKQQATTNFIGTSSNFQISGIEPKRVSYNTALGVDAKLNEHFTLNANYNYVKKSKNHSHTVLVKFRFYL